MSNNIFAAAQALREAKMKKEQEQINIEVTSSNVSNELNRLQGGMITSANPPMYTTNNQVINTQFNNAPTGHWEKVKIETERLRTEVKANRKAQKLSQADVARLAKTSKTTIGRFEKYGWGSFQVIMSIIIATKTKITIN